MIRTTFIMGPNRRVTNIISMVIFNLEVICRFRTFKQFVLNLLNNDILAVEHNKDISCTEINSTCPTLLRNIERMHRCADDLLTGYLYTE